MASSISDKLSRKGDAAATCTRRFAPEFRRSSHGTAVAVAACSSVCIGGSHPCVINTLVILGCATFVLALSTIPAEAQRRHRGGGGGVTVIRHSPLLWGGGFHGGFYRPVLLRLRPVVPVSISGVRISAGHLSRRWRRRAAAAGDAARRVGLRRRLRGGSRRRLRRRVPAAAARARSSRNRHLSSEPSHAATEHLLQPGIDAHDPSHARTVAAGRHRRAAAGAARDACVSGNARTAGVR